MMKIFRGRLLRWQENEKKFANMYQITFDHELKADVVELLTIFNIYVRQNHLN